MNHEQLAHTLRPLVMHLAEIPNEFLSSEVVLVKSFLLMSMHVCDEPDYGERLRLVGLFTMLLGPYLDIMNVTKES